MQYCLPLHSTKDILTNNRQNNISGYIDNTQKRLHHKLIAILGKRPNKRQKKILCITLTA